MISDLDETLKQLLIKKGKLEPAEVDISFEMPDREWSASISKPTVNLYLYDIHENRDLRNNQWNVTNNNGFATRTKPPVRVDLSYLITVWTNDTADQHRLLGYLLATLFRYQELPGELLQGDLKKLDYPLLTTTAQLDEIIIQNVGQFWNALDNQLKPSINYVVTIPVDTDVTMTAPVVFTKLVKFKGPDGAPPDEIVQVSGVISHKGKPDQVIPDANIIIKELQMTASTDEEGKYTFRKLVSGSYTMEISAPGEKKRQIKIAVPSASYDIEI
jgi:hypothetical protein